MDIEFDLDSEAGVAIGIVEGSMSLEDIQQAALAMWRKVESPRMRILWDLRAARFDLSTGEVQALAKFVRDNAPSGELRTAFVVSSDLEFGLVRMFEVFREGDGRTAAFRDRERALAWVAGKE